MLVATPHQTPVSADDLSAADHRRTVLAGLGFGALAYGSWGFAPFYFKAVASVDPVEVLCHRVIWSVGLLAALVHLRRQWGACRALLGAWKNWPTLSCSTGLIAVNWLVFIYAVGAGRLVEASLGYFINPLVSILLGMVFLGERLRPAQWAAVALAVAGVAVEAYSLGHLPWISLTLAVSFGLYGLARKKSHTGPVVGLFFETALLLPLAAGYLVVMAVTGARGIVFLSREGVGSAGMDTLLIAGGVITTLPLLWFAAAARRLRLSTIGFMQYSAPTIQFLIAVLAFGEPFGFSRAVSFGLIWCGIGVFVTDSAASTLRAARRGPALGVG